MPHAADSGAKGLLGNLISVKLRDRLALHGVTLMRSEGEKVCSVLAGKYIPVHERVALGVVIPN